MQKNKNFVDIMCQEYSATLKTQNRKPMKPHINIISIGEEKSEYYLAKYEGGQISIQASQSAIAVTALADLQVGVRSGHFPEYLGTRKPQLPLRPLWPERAGPHSARRILELGFNAIVVDGSKEREKIVELCEHYHAHNIQVICQVQSIEELERAGQGRGKGLPDKWLYKSQIGQTLQVKHTASLNTTILDRLEQELQTMEAAAKNKGLLFYLPYFPKQSEEKQARWCEYLSKVAGRYTHLAFPAVVAKQDGQKQLHPFWQLLRMAIDPIETPLLPVVDAGHAGEGRGYWPTVDLEYLQEIRLRTSRHKFAGWLSQTSLIPKLGGVLDCSLWIAGHAQWGDLPELLLETWLSANFPGCFQSCKLVKSAGNLLSAMHKLRQVHQMDSLRKTVEHLLQEANRLNSNNEQLEAYFRYFRRDIRRKLLDFLQKKNISISGCIEADDLEDGFWTKGIRQAGDVLKVTLLESPFVNPSDNEMKAIYDLNK